MTMTRIQFIKLVLLAPVALLSAPFVSKRPQCRVIREEDFAFKILDRPCFMEACWIEEPGRLRMLK